MRKPQSLKHLFTVSMLGAVLAAEGLSAQGVIERAQRAAEEAARQARERQQHQQQPAQTDPKSAGQNGSTPASAAPWTPPADNPNAQPVTLDPLKLPDVIGASRHDVRPLFEWLQSANEWRNP